MNTTHPPSQVSHYIMRYRKWLKNYHMYPITMSNECASIVFFKYKFFPSAPTVESDESKNPPIISQNEQQQNTSTPNTCPFTNSKNGNTWDIKVTQYLGQTVKSWIRHWLTPIYTLVSWAILIILKNVISKKNTIS